MHLLILTANSHKISRVMLAILALGDCPTDKIEEDACHSLSGGSLLISLNKYYF